MNCKDIKTRGLLLDLIEGELSGEDEASVKAHLSGCPGCREELDSLRELLGKIKALPVPDPGEEFWKEFPERVRKGLEEERKKQAERGEPIETSDTGLRWWDVPGWIRAFAPMAAVGVLIALGIFLGQERNRADIPVLTKKADIATLSKEELIEVGERLSLASELESELKEEDRSMLADADFSLSTEVGLYYDLYELEPDELVMVYERLDTLSMPTTMSS